MILRYKELDSLRGIAAILVILFHYTMLNDLGRLGFKLGVTGVDLFFIISGFVIFMTIQRVSSVFEFAINRFTRLYPTYWVCVSFTFLLYMLAEYLHKEEQSPSFVEYLANMSMFQYYLNVDDLDGPYWTMIIEILFYAVIAFSFLVKKLNYVVPLGLTILLLIGIYASFLDLSFPFIQTIQKEFPLMVHLPLFLAGIIFYKLKATPMNGKERLTQWLNLLLCFFIKLSLIQYGGRYLDFISQKEYTVMLGVYFLIFITFIKGKLGFLVNQPLLFLGKISFALYLIHQYLSIGIIIPYLMNQRGFHFWSSALLALIISICLATFITYFIEVPAKKLNNFLKGLLKIPKYANKDS